MTKADPVKAGERRSPPSEPPAAIHPAMFQIARLLARLEVAAQNGPAATAMPINDNAPEIES